MILSKNVISGMFLAVNAMVVSAPSQASLVEVDLVAGSGDGLLTLDTATGLEWLDLTETVGLSWNNIILDGIGGWLDQGFRYSTSNEVAGLFANAGISQTLPEWTPTGESQAVSDLQQLIGITETSSGKAYTFGITGAESSLDSHFAFALGVRNSGETSAVVEWNEIANSASSATIGHALVREATVVPVPAAVYLFISGIIGMLPLMRRKSSAN